MSSDLAINSNSSFSTNHKLPQNTSGKLERRLIDYYPTFKENNETKVSKRNLLEYNKSKLIETDSQFALPEVNSAQSVRVENVASNVLPRSSSASSSKELSPLQQSLKKNNLYPCSPGAKKDSPQYKYDKIVADLQKDNLNPYQMYEHIFQLSALRFRSDQERKDQTALMKCCMEFGLSTEEDKNNYKNYIFDTKLTSYKSKVDKILAPLREGQATGHQTIDRLDDFADDQDDYSLGFNADRHVEYLRLIEASRINLKNWELDSLLPY